MCGYRGRRDRRARLLLGLAEPQERGAQDDQGHSSRVAEDGGPGEALGAWGYGRRVRKALRKSCRHGVGVQAEDVRAQGVLLGAGDERLAEVGAARPNYSTLTHLLSS